VVVSGGVLVGAGVVVTATVVVGAGVVVTATVVVGAGVVVTPAVVVGAGVVFGGHVVRGGCVVVGLQPARAVPWSASVTTAGTTKPAAAIFWIKARRPIPDRACGSSPRSSLTGRLLDLGD
jgi:hypothetical protein